MGMSRMTAQPRTLQETGAGNGWRPAARLRTSELLEGAKTKRGKSSWRQRSLVACAAAGRRMACISFKRLS